MSACRVFRCVTLGNVHKDLNSKLLGVHADVETNLTLLDLRVLLESVSFLFHITAFSGKANDSHLTSAKTALAALQSHTPTTCAPHAPVVHAASSSKATAAASNATPPGSDTNEQPCAALQLLNVAPDGTARVDVLQDCVKYCLPEDSERRAPAVARVQEYSDAIASSSGTEQATLLKWGLGADAV